MQLLLLDALSTWLLKYWLSLPCTTTSVLFNPPSLNIPTFTSLYTKCQTLSFAQLSLSLTLYDVCSVLDFKVNSSSFKHKLYIVTFWKKPRLSHPWNLHRMHPPLLSNTGTPNILDKINWIHHFFPPQRCSIPLFTRPISPALLNKPTHGHPGNPLSSFSLPNDVMSFVLRSFIDCLPWLYWNVCHLRSWTLGVFLSHLIMDLRPSFPSG